VTGKRYAVVSCHVEAILDDRTWEAFSAFQESAPGGFRIAPLVRPPDEAAGEAADVWLERARAAGSRGPLGHHTHFVGPGHARPPHPGPEHGERVRREAGWLREQGLRPRFFCGGGWYMDAGVASILAELGYVDCTATAFRPSYLDDAAPRLSLDRPARLVLGRRRLLAIPTTHSLGQAARATLDPEPMPAVVHVYFHDTDLLSRRRRLALRATLVALARRRDVSDLDEVAAEAEASAPELPFPAT